MIPKIIHYCWFGGNPLPELAQKCIESWKVYLPDYKIKEWNESNFDLNCCTYVRGCILLYRMEKDNEVKLMSRCSISLAV